MSVIGFAPVAITGGTIAHDQIIFDKAAIVFVRREEGWLSEIVSGNDASLDLPEIGITVPLHDVYANAGLSDVRQEGSAV